MNMEERPFSQAGIIDRFEERQVIIKTADQQEVRWPINNLPEQVKQGDGVRLVITTSQTAEEDREELAKTLLNRLLSNA